MEDWNPQFLISRSIYQNRRILRSWGWGWQSMQDSFSWVCGWTSAWRGLMTGIFGILESSATQWYQDVAQTQEFLFLIVTSIVYGATMLALPAIFTRSSQFEFLHTHLLRSPFLIVNSINPVDKLIELFRAAIRRRPSDGFEKFWDLYSILPCGKVRWWGLSTFVKEIKRLFCLFICTELQAQCRLKNFLLRFKLFYVL